MLQRKERDVGKDRERERQKEHTISARRGRGQSVSVSVLHSYLPDPDTALTKMLNGPATCTGKPKGKSKAKQQQVDTTLSHSLSSSVSLCVRSLFANHGKSLESPKPVHKGQNSTNWTERASTEQMYTTSSSKSNELNLFYQNEEFFFASIFISLSRRLSQRLCVVVPLCCVFGCSLTLFSPYAL